jgi:hypothetical protein
MPRHRFRAATIGLAALVAACGTKPDPVLEAVQTGVDRGGAPTVVGTWICDLQERQLVPGRQRLVVEVNLAADRTGFTRARPYGGETGVGSRGQATTGYRFTWRRDGDGIRLRGVGINNERSSRGSGGGTGSVVISLGSTRTSRRDRGITRSMLMHAPNAPGLIEVQDLTADSVTLVAQSQHLVGGRDPETYLCTRRVATAG